MFGNSISKNLYVGDMKKNDILVRRELKQFNPLNSAVSLVQAHFVFADKNIIQPL